MVGGWLAVARCVDWREARVVYFPSLGCLVVDLIMIVYDCERCFLPLLYCPYAPCTFFSPYCTVCSLYLYLHNGCTSTLQYALSPNITVTHHF